MRAADAAALATVSHETLVQRAGTAVAQAALRLLGGGAYGRRVVVVAGKGSNGADGRVAASVLARRGARVTVVEAEGAPAVLPACDLVVDGAYGTGFRGTYEAPAAPAGAAVLAIDIPSGVDADTGAAPGGRAVRADRTVTFAALKPGLLQGEGAACSGQVEVADIGIGFPTPRALAMEDADIDALLPARAAETNKWTNAVGVAAGSPGMEGAAVLSTRGAMAAGAGMIRLGSPGHHPETTWPVEAVRMSLPEEGWAGAFLEATAKCKAVVIGPGLGTGPEVGEEIRTVIAALGVPLVIDADALTALGDTGSARQLLDKRSAPSVLTPHDGEYAAPGRRGTRPGPAGGGPGAGRSHGGGRAREGLAHRGGRPRRGRCHPRRAALGRRRSGAGHGRQWRRAVGHHRRLPGPGRAGAPGGGAGGARARAGGGPGPPGRPGGRGPARAGGGGAVGTGPWLRAPARARAQRCPCRCGWRPTPAR